MQADMKVILIQTTRNALFLTPVKSGRRASFGVPRNFELPGNMRMGGAYSDLNEFAKFVSDCIAKSKFGIKKIIFCIEDDNVICKEYQHLPCKSKNLLSFAKLEADSVLSDNINDYLLQNYEYGRQNEVTGKMTSSLFAIKSSLVSSITKIFSKFDLHVKKIVPPVGGLLYASKKAIDSHGKTIAVLDLSFEKTRLIVLHEGFPIFIRTFEAIYDDIAEIIMKSRAVSYDETVDLIHSYGVYGVNSANPTSESANQITTLLDTCASEAVRNIRMVLSSERLELNKMVLCGAMATLPNFSEFWNQLGLDVPIETIDLCVATSKLPEVNATARRAGYRISSFFTVSGLLSARKTDDIDFLNTVKAKSSAKMKNVSVLALITVFALGVMALEPLLYSLKFTQSTQDKAALTAVKYTEIKQLLKTQNDLSTQLTHTKSDQEMLPQHKSKAMNVTQQLFDQITAKTKSVDTFNIDNTAGNIVIAFQTVTYSDYLIIKKTIETNGYFNIAVPFTATINDTGTYSCSVTLTWKDFVALNPSGKVGGTK